MKTCNCCHTNKPSGAFSQSRLGYAKHCRDCGAWLILFRQVFGPVRDVLANRAATRERKRRMKAAPANEIYKVWLRA